MKEKQKFNNEALTASIENENKKTAALRNETSEKNATLEMLTKVQKETQQFKDQSEKYKVCKIFLRSSKLNRTRRGVQIRSTKS